MKKFGIIILAAVFCMALAMPAMAKVRVGGAVSYGWGYGNYDQDHMRNYAGGAFADEKTNIDMSVTIGTRLFASWINSKKTLGGEIAFNLVGENSAASGLTEGLRTRFAYAWWQINPKVKLTVGQQWVMYSWLTAPQNNGVGFTGSSENAGYGNVGNDREPGIRLDVKFTDSMTVSLGAFAPSSGIARNQGSWNTADDETTSPRWEIMVTGKLGPFTFYPSYMFGKIAYEADLSDTMTQQLADNDLSYWGFSLPVKASFGPFDFSGEYNTGENLGNSSLWGSWPNVGGGVPGVVGRPLAEFGLDGSGTGRRMFYDAEYDGWWVQAKYKAFKKMSIQFIYGEEEVEMDRFGLAADWKADRDMWMIQFPITLQPFFFLTPYYGKFDLGSLDFNAATGAGTAIPAGFSLLDGEPLGEVTVYGAGFWIMF
ncbi:MAG: hypothetical protein JRC68_00570 [Deltaproteobacteria bacterium]|nr:hypothetical protein [Deltaproteobacteria bacterium]